MKNATLLSITFLMINFITYAQTFNCNGDYSESNTLNIIFNNNWVPQNKENNSINFIPVVFHVLYHTSTENIPDVDIYSQLGVLNQDFARLNPDTINTPMAFKSLASSVKIQFCLADKDTLGNPTSGITRHYTDTAVFKDTFLGNNQYYQSSTGGVPPWDPVHYLNIYVIRRSYFSGTASNGNNGHGQQWDGIAMQFSHVKNFHTLTHEVGHYLGLSHIFGGTLGEVSCGDDFISDTPIQTFNYNCPNFPKYSCGNTTVSDMFMNYMDYSPSTCKNLFTKGQANKMETILNTIRYPLLNSTSCNLSNNTSSFETNNFNIFPNPFSTSTNLQSDVLFNEITLTIYNSSGQMIKQINNISGKLYNLQRDNLPNGLYFIRLSKDFKVIGTNKLLITD